MYQNLTFFRGNSMRFLIPVIMLAVSALPVHAPVAPAQRQSAGVAGVHLYLFDSRTGELSKDILKIPDFQTWNGSVWGTGIPETFSFDNEFLITIGFFPRTNATCSAEWAKVRLLFGNRVMIQRDLRLWNGCADSPAALTYRAIHVLQSFPIPPGSDKAVLEISFIGRVTRIRLPNLFDGGE